MKFTLRPLFSLLVFLILLVACQAAIAQVPSYVPTSGLLMYYGFNGSATDLSGHGVTGTVSGATYCSDRFGHPNAALNFVGSGEVVTTHHIDRTATNTFTYSVWVNPTNSAILPAAGSSSGLTSDESNSCIIAPVDGWNWASGMSDVGAGLNVATNGVYVMEHGQSITNCTLSWSGTLTGWHYIVLEYVSKQPSLYVDGVYVASGYTSSYTVHPSMACDSFFDSYYPYLTAGFGHGLFPIVVPSYNFAGQLDDLSIYGRALTSCEITQLYDTGSSVITVTGLSSLCPGATTTYSVSTTGGVWSSSNTGVAMIGTGSGVVTATGIGVCNISYTTGSGCSGIAALTVSALPNIVSPASLCIGASSTLTIPLTGGTWACGSPGTIGSTSGILTGVSAGSCHISYILPTGCYSPTVVTINPNPPTPYGAGQVCVGATTTLTDSITGGTWASSSGTYATAGASTGLISGITAGPVTITYTLPTGCMVIDPFVVNPLPAVITGTASVCQGLTTTLSDATTGGSWASGTATIATIGAGTGLVTGAAVGTSIISYILPTSCKVTKIVTVNPLPGIISGTSVICQGGSAIFSDAGTGTWSSSNPSVASIASSSGAVSGIAAGTATITYTLPTTCMITYGVSINPAPAAIVGLSGVCAGASTTLTDITPGGVWSSGSPGTATAGSTGLVSGIAAGLVNISYTLPTGCASSLTFTVNPNPTSITGSGVLCTGQTSMLTDAGGGTWTSGTTSVATIGSLTGLITAGLPGTSSITYTLPTGCTATVTETVNGVPLPITGVTVICAGATSLLSDLTAGGSWSSSNTAVAAIGSSSGLMTGTGAGSANITYTLPTGCIIIKGVTINPLPAPVYSPDSICTGLTTTLSDAGAGSWTSSNPTVATIGSLSGFVSALVAGTTTITYTLPTGCLITSGLTVDPLPAGITGSGTLCTGTTTLLHDATTGGTWSSSDFTIAYIDPGTGMVTGYSGGPATILYSSVSGCTASFSVSVSPLPASITGTTILCAGTTTSLFDAGGTWSCSPSSVATINLTTGVLSGVSAGIANVTYTLPTGCLTTIPVMVNSSPLPISGPAGMCVGLTSLMTDGTPGGIWGSSAPSVASIYSTSGVITAGSIGTTTISYTLGTGCSTSVNVTVNSSPGPVTGTLSVCPNGTTLLSNGAPGGTWSITPMGTAIIGTSSGLVTGLLPGTATVTYSLGAGCTVTGNVTVNPLPGYISGTPVVCVGSTVLLTDPTPGGTWASGSTLIASAAPTTGVITGDNTGTSVISYTLSTGCYRTVLATVNPLPPPISGPSGVCAGSVIDLTDPGSGGVWGSSPGTVATIGTTGIVTGVLAGMATVSYTLSTGCKSTKTVYVNPLPGLITGPTQVCVGSSVTLTDAGGGTWSTGSSIITVGSVSGVVNAIETGVATVTYTLSTGCQVSANITVNALPAPIGGASAVCVGASITLTDTGSGTWSSSVPAYATAGSATGIITGIATGPATITYLSAAGCIATHIVTVSSSPGAITGPSGVCAGGTITLSDPVPGGSWSSSNVLAGTVGILTGVLSGLTSGLSTTITYSLGAGCTVTKVVTISPSPAAITGSTALCAWMTTPLGDVTTGGTWSSSPLIIATVSATGVVTGMSGGTATIDYTVAGCSATKLITINATPSAISGPTIVCMEGMITESDGTSGGLWTTSSTTITIGSTTGVITGIAAGTAIISYGAGTCLVGRTIYINPIPVISGPTGYCTGATGTLAASVPGGSWFSGLTSVAAVGGTTGVVTAGVAGSSVIYYTLPTGCSASVTVTVNSGPGTIFGSRNVCLGGISPLLDATSGGTWSITPVTTATIGSSSGIVGGLLTGTATVTYSLGSGCIITTIVTVNPMPAIITGTPVVCAGLTTALADATPGGTWTSGGTGVAGIGATTGLVTGVTYGTALIDYTLPTGCSANMTVTVNPPPAAITGASGVCTGTTTLFSDITTGGVWSSSAPPKATVDSAGNVSGISSGFATITYTLPTGCLITKPVTVNVSPGAISGGGSVCVGSVLVLSDLTPGGVWSSSVTTVGTISTTGALTGSSSGTTTVTYSVGGCLATKVVSVNTLPGGIMGPGVVCIGTAITKTDGSPGGVWTSSNTSVAIAGTATGIITGVAAGTATITYSMGVGCNVYAPVTVNGLPLSVSGPAGICTGSSASYTDATPGGVWSVSNPAVGIITTTGTLSGISGGSVTVSYTALLGCAATETVTVVTVPAITGVHNICAYGDTMTVSDLTTTGLYTSSLATITNLGGGIGRVTGNTPGPASVTYISPLGCTTTTLFTVNPIPGPISGTGHICAGSTLSLSDYTPGGLWSSGSPSVAIAGSGTGIVSGTGGGTAYIYYTLPTGCKVDTPVVVYSLPAAITGPASAFLGSPITVADAVPGGVWHSSNPGVATVGLSSGYVTGITTGSVILTYTAGSLCSVTRSITIMPSMSGHRSTVVTESDQYKLWPNPATSSITVTSADAGVLRIINISGQLVADYPIQAGDNMLSLPAGLSDGVYITEFTSETGGIKTVRLVVGK